MGNYFCKFSFNMPAIFFNTNSWQFGLFSNIFQTSSVFSSEPSSSPSSSRIFFVPIQTRSMWMLDCLFARWYLIKSLSKCYFNCYVAFSFEKFFYNKSSLFFSYMRYFRYFISIFSPELSTYDPWNSLLVCQFPKNLINKTIVLRNQPLVKLYENNNLGLCDLQKLLKKLYLTWGGFF